MTQTKPKTPKEYSRTELICGNLAIVLWISIGAISCAVFYPIAGVLFFVLAAYIVFYELGKHGCLSCYYCKTCTIGIGKLPEFFFKKTGTANVNRRALRLFPFAYLLLSVLPTVLLVVSLFQETLTYKVALLTAILAFSSHTGLIRWKTLTFRY